MPDKKSFSLIGLLAVAVVVSANPLQHFGALTVVHSMEQIDDQLILATTGGIIGYTTADRTSRVYRDLTFLPDLHIRILARAGKKIWAATEKGYLIHLSHDGTVLSTVNLLAGYGLTISCLYPYQDHLVVGHNKGISIYSPEKNALTENISTFADFPNSQVLDITSANDTLAVLTADGIAFTTTTLSILNRDPGNWLTRPAPGMVAFSSVEGELSALPYLERRRGSIVYTAQGNTLLRNGAALLSLPSNITDFVAGSDHTVYAGTASNGAYIIDNSGSLVDSIVLDGPFSSTVEYCAVDTRGTLWYVSDYITEGIGYFTGKEWGVVTPENEPAIGTLSPGRRESWNRIYTFPNGDIWAATHSMGGKWFHAAENKWYSFEDANSPNPDGNSPIGRLSEDPGGWWTFISSVCLDSNGYYWLANQRSNWSGKVVHVFDPKNRSWRTLTASSHNLNKYFTGPIAAGRDTATGRHQISLGYFVDESGGLQGMTLLSYAGTNPMNAVISTYHSNEELGVNDLKVDKTGTLWVATRAGLYRALIESNRYNYTLIEKTAGAYLKSVTLSPDGLPVFVMDGDIYMYDDTDSSLTNMTNTGFLSEYINGITYDATAKAYWVASNDGLSRFDATAFSIAERRSLLRMYPNPVSLSKHPNGCLFDRLFPDESGNYRLTLFSLDGDVVRTFRRTYSVRPGNPTERKAIQWNLKNSDNRTVLPGTYIYRGSGAEGKGEAGKAVVVP